MVGWAVVDLGYFGFDLLDGAKWPAVIVIVIVTADLAHLVSKRSDGKTKMTGSGKNDC